MPHIRRRGGFGGSSVGRIERGQSLVEFALVLPMLLVLLLGIADFGRVFSAGITIEAASRDGAEAAAQEYLQLRRSTPGIQPTPSTYDSVLARAQAVTCDEMKKLSSLLPPACERLITLACLHDEWGDHCGPASGAIPTDCANLSASGGAMAVQAGGLPYVEVKACYQFQTLINISNLRLPLGWSLTLGDMWLQRDRSFTVADY